MGKEELVSQAEAKSTGSERSERGRKGSALSKVSSLNIIRRMSVNPFPFGITELSKIADEHDNGAYLEGLGGIETVLASINSSDQNGINPEEIPTLKRVFGENRIPEPARKTYLGLLFEAMKDTTLIVLMIAAIVSLGLSFVKIGAEGVCDDFNPNNALKPEEKHGAASTEFIEALAIIGAVIIVSNVTAGNDYSKEKQFRKLNEASRNSDLVQVIRGGKRDEIQVQELVVGDVMLVNTGDRVPADGVTLTAQGMKCDESSLTGEPDAKTKTRGVYMKAGALVQEGYGQMAVTAVGVNTDSGQSQMLLRAEAPPPTPLQVKLVAIATFIGKIGFGVACLTFVCGMIRFGVCRGQSDLKWENSELRILLKFLVLCITIVVVAVPEGLPLAVTISLAYSMKKMMDDQNLVRKLQACETMGGATNICSDKTGTLTENRMSVVQGIVCGEYHKPVATKDELASNGYSPSALHTFFGALVVNTGDATFVQKINGVWDYKGNKTECALLALCQDMGGDFQEIKGQIAESKSLLKSITFSSDRKRMSTMVKLSDTSLRVYCKGAAEIVLGLCTHKLTPSGDVVPLDAEKHAEMAGHISTFAKSGLRTICLTYRDISGLSGDIFEWTQAAEDTEFEKDLVLVGLVGIKDPVRPEVPGAVANCKKAGITVRMVTGDNIDTATHIARECGILDDNGITIEGNVFRELSDEELIKILPRLQVMARSKPADKYRLVKTLRSLGEVVAVTGDGTNDAPALKEADVGLAMGITGTDIAKKASDIIILDDNFASIVRSVMWGRNVYDSIRKFLQFQLTVNICALCVAFVGAVVNSRSPLAPIQLLWVNLIMDTLAALALATESPTPELLLRKPYGRYDSLVSPRMWVNILGQAALQMVVLLVQLFVGEKMFLTHVHDDDLRFDKNNTMVFHTFVFFQLFNEINCRRLDRKVNVFKGIFRNHIFFAVMFITVLLQSLIVEYGGEAFQTVSLSAGEFFICVAIGALSLPWCALLKQFDFDMPRLPFGRRPKVLMQDSEIAIEGGVEMQS